MNVWCTKLKKRVAFYFPKSVLLPSSLKFPYWCLRQQVNYDSVSDFAVDHRWLLCRGCGLLLLWSSSRTCCIPERCSYTTVNSFFCLLDSTITQQQIYLSPPHSSGQQQQWYLQCWCIQNLVRYSGDFPYSPLGSRPVRSLRGWRGTEGIPRIHRWAATHADRRKKKTEMKILIHYTLLLKIMSSIMLLVLMYVICKVS